MPRRISDEGVYSWQWDVTAKSTGNHKLHLVVTAVVESGGIISADDVLVFDTPITIDVTLRQRVASFVGSNWQWLWAVLLAPLAAFVVARFRGKDRGSSFADKPLPIQLEKAAFGKRHQSDGWRVRQGIDRLTRAA